MLRLSLRPCRGASRSDTGGVAGAEVSLDGRPVGATPLAAFEVEAGERRGRESGRGLRGVPAPRRGRGARERAVAGRDALVAAADSAARARRRRRRRRCWRSSERSRGRAGRAWTGATAARRRSSCARAGARAHGAAHEGGPRRRGGVGRGCGPARGARRRSASTPRLGEVKVAARPPDAELLVDGEPRAGPTRRCSSSRCRTRSRSAARATRPCSQTVTPRPGLSADGERRAQEPASSCSEEKTPRVARSPEGHELRLVEGGRIKIGALAARARPPRQRAAARRRARRGPSTSPPARCRTLQFRRFERGALLGPRRRRRASTSTTSRWCA